MNVLAAVAKLALAGFLVGDVHSTIFSWQCKHGQVLFAALELNQGLVPVDIIVGVDVPLEASQKQGVRLVGVALWKSLEVRGVLAKGDRFSCLLVERSP